MTEDELAHVLRAAAEIAGDPQIIVIGSQAVLGTYPDAVLPHEATRSVEADLMFVDDPEAAKADRVDSAIGEESMFHQTHGYYAQGVVLSTAVLPTGWENRTVAFDRPDAEPAQAHCLEIYDIVAAKLVAGREKDHEYTAALISAGLVNVGTLRDRCELLPPPVRSRVLDRIRRLAS